MTNRQVSAQAEAGIRSVFEAIDGVQSCLVLAESWLEDTIDANVRLLRLVPRLYGIGDLSQILSAVIQQQTAAVLEDLAPSLRTFVPTESYRCAERLLVEHGFVVLVGPPASGKSTIAANLCMLTSLHDVDVRVLRIEHSGQFGETWSPADSRTIYWVDDVFGETTLDDLRLREWSAALLKVEAARKRGARIIFCTRDYILAAAELRLKRAKVDSIHDARVRVQVNNLTKEEREQMLYNHIKEGNITRERKSELKAYLAELAQLPGFSPELARRLGDKRFHVRLQCDRTGLVKFFEQPVQYFRDVLHGLSETETAVLAVCLMANNAVPDPVPEDCLTRAVLSTFGVSVQHVREAFELLEGSLVKRVRGATTQTWQFQHPSMIDAVQENLATKSSQLLLYLKSARIAAILRDTTTDPTSRHDHILFLPASVYSHLIQRFCNDGAQHIEALSDYLATRASDALLVAVNDSCPALLDCALAIPPEPEGLNAGPKLALRLSRVSDATLLNETRLTLLTCALDDSAQSFGWAGFLSLEGLVHLVPQFVRDFLIDEMETDFRCIDTLCAWYSGDNPSSKEEIESTIEAVESQAETLAQTLSLTGLSSVSTQELLEQRANRLIQRLQERLTDIECQEDWRAEMYEDEWRERWYERSSELAHCRFDDVDE